MGILVFLLKFSLDRFDNKTSEAISIKMIHDEPVYFVDEEDIRNIVTQSNPSKKIGNIDVSALEKKIAQLPMVDSANVYLKLNGELNLDIIQRIPIFRLKKLNKEVYVDKKGVEFPLSRSYSYPCMLVSGDIREEEYPGIIELVERINKDEFTKNFFVGINKRNNNYYLLTNDGNYKVELGDLQDIDLKIQGFKAFVEKYLIYQDPLKYSKISLKYHNQIITTLRKKATEEERKEEPKEEQKTEEKEQKKDKKDKKEVKP